MDTTHSTVNPSEENPLQPVLEAIQGGDPAAICAKYNITHEVLEERIEAYQASTRQLALSDDDLITRKVGRNEPCPCGSGKKYKKCCLPKHEEARKNMPAGQFQEKVERDKQKRSLEKEVKKGFDLLFSEDFAKAQRLVETLLKSYPEDDRLHDILVSVSLGCGDYDSAFYSCRRRWQVAMEEKAFLEENGHFKREGGDGSGLVHFFSPSAWLEKLWISQRARAYREKFPKEESARLTKMVEQLKAANDTKRFPARQEEGYEVRRKALEPVLEDLQAEGPAAIPHLLPLTYNFSWASLFVPDLLGSYATDSSILLLSELSMFRLPFFAQKCLSRLEGFGESAIPQVEQVLEENPAFDELKVGLVMLLGIVQTAKTFAILTKLIDHENPYVVSWVAQALGKHTNPDALPFLNRAQERLEALSKVAGAIRSLGGDQRAASDE